MYRKSPTGVSKEGKNPASTRVPGASLKILAGQHGVKGIKLH